MILPTLPKMQTLRHSYNSFAKWKINGNDEIIVKDENGSRFKPDNNHRTKRDHHAAPSSYVHTFPGGVFPIRVYLDKADSIRQKGQVIKISGRFAAPW